MDASLFLRLSFSSLLCVTSLQLSFSPWLLTKEQQNKLDRPVYAYSHSMTTQMGSPMKTMGQSNCSWSKLHISDEAHLVCKQWFVRFVRFHIKDKFGFTDNTDCHSPWYTDLWWFIEAEKVWWIFFVLDCSGLCCLEYCRHSSIKVNLANVQAYVNWALCVFNQWWWHVVVTVYILLGLPF